MRNIVVFAILISSVLVFGFTTLTTNQQDMRFMVPEGFTVEQVAGNDQVGSVVAFTFDNQGRMVIAKEFGDIVAMIPRDDGTYEQRLVSDQLTNSQGIVYDGPDLLATVIGPEGVGLYRAIDENGDARAERVELIESVNRRIEDHGPHAPIWGPDGLLYWMQANTAGIYEDPAPLSPVRKFHEASLLSDRGGFYRTPEGKVYRNEIAKHAGTAGYEPSRPNYSDWELYSMGHRNAYDFAFNLIGELFTYDSDHEPDLDMPWYRSTRTNHILPGGEYGYREGAAVHPDYYFDNAPLLEDMERGSPTGVETYLAYNYPEKYWDAPLFADWSRGRILVSILTKEGAGYVPESSNFVFGTPLNVTDLEVGPDGNLYFTLGGRDTEGGIYRIIYNGPDTMERPQINNPIDEVLTLIQPRSAFSRQRANDIKEQIGNEVWQQELTTVAGNTLAELERRIRAIELMAVHGTGLSENLLRTLAGDSVWQIRATAAYYLGMRSTENARQILAGLLDDSDQFVQRRAAEGLMRTGLHPAMEAPVSPTEDIFPLLASKDASLRFAGRILLRTINTNLWREEILQLTEYPQVTEALLAYVQTVGDHQDMYNYSRILNRQYELLQANPSEEQLLDLVRLMQYSMTKDQGVRGFPLVESSSRVTGGVLFIPGEGWFNSDQIDPDGTGGSSFSGRSQNLYTQLGLRLLDRFPGSDWRLNRELARILAYLQTDGAVNDILAELQTESNQKQQIHYVDMVTRIEAGWNDQNIETMSNWFVNAAENGLGGGDIAEMRSRFISYIPDEQGEIVMARIEEAQPEGGFGGFFGGGGSDMSEEDVQALIFDPENTHGNPAAGFVAFEKAACIACHTFGPVGISQGPDLTTINQRFNREDIVRSIVYPSEVIADQYEGVTVTLTDGSIIYGTIVQENNQELILQIPGGGEITIPASQIESQQTAEVSMMPSGLMNELSNQERRDLLLFLLEGPSAIADSTLERINNE